VKEGDIVESQQEEKSKPSRFGEFRAGVSSLCVATVLFLFGICVFSRAFLWGEFVYDDLIHVVDNPVLKSPDGWLSILSTPVFPGSLYRPLTFVSFWLQTQVVGEVLPTQFLFVNAVLHGANTALLYVLLSRVSFPALLSVGKKRISTVLCASLLFAAHPLHTEVVANGVGRAELLAFFFGMLGIMTLSSTKVRLLPWVLFLCAVLSKESGVVFPLLAILFMWYRGEKIPYTRWLKRYALFLLAFGAVRFLLTGSLLHHGTVSFIDNPLASLSFQERLPNAIYLLEKYLALILVPYPLSADYSYATLAPLSLSGFSGIVSAFALGLLGVILLLAFTSLRSRSVHGFGLVWFFVAFLPTANIVFPIGTIFGERLAYTPSAGGVLLLAWIFSLIATRYPRTASVSALMTFLFFLSSTILYQGVWQNQETLIERQAARFPNSVKMAVNLATLRIQQGHFDAAEEAIERALSFYPASADALLVRARLYSHRGENERAKMSLEEALQYEPLHLEALDMFARILLKERRFEEALPVLEKGLRENPRHERLLSAQYFYEVATDNLSRALSVQKQLEAIGSDDPDFLRIREQIQELMREKIVLEPESSVEEASPEDAE
jgi:tetratricopeptide (TPR) repeat protein